MNNRFRSTILLSLMIFAAFSAPAYAEGNTGPGGFAEIIQQIIDYFRYFFATPESSFNLTAINDELSINEPKLTMEHRGFYSASLNERKNYTILLPPDYRKSSKRYPVYYLLHGAWGNERTWATRGNITRIYQDMIQETGEMIIVMPDGGNTVWENGCSFIFLSCGNKEDYFFEFVKHIESGYRTTEKRAVGGLSFGARGAMRMAFLHPENFSFVGSHSGYYSFLLQEMTEEKWDRLNSANLTIYFDHSRNDVLTEYSQSSVDLHKNLTARAIDHEYRQLDYYAAQSHAWPLWKMQVKVALAKACERIC